MNKNNMELFRSMYYYEAEHKEKINSRIAVPGGVVPLLVGGAIYFIDHVGDVAGEIWIIVMCITLSVYLISIVITIYFLLRSIIGFSYGYIPTPQQIHNYTIQLEQYFQDESESERESKINDKIDELLYDEYMERTEHNIAQNEKKLMYLRMAGFFLVLSVLFGASNIIPFTFGKTEKLQTQQVKIINWEDKTIYDRGDNCGR